MKPVSGSEKSINTRCSNNDKRGYILAFLSWAGIKFPMAIVTF